MVELPIAGQGGKSRNASTIDNALIIWYNRDVDWSFYPPTHDAGVPNRPMYCVSWHGALIGVRPTLRHMASAVTYL
jgi:hypothetical protein